MVDVNKQLKEKKPTPRKMSEEDVLKEILKLREAYSRTLSKILEKDADLRIASRRIRTLIKKSDFLKTITQTLPNDNEFHLLPVKSVKQKLKAGSDVENKALKKLLSKSKDLKAYENLEISIKNPQAKDFEVGFICPLPEYIKLNVKGKTLKKEIPKKRASEFLDRTAQSQCLLNEIEIVDTTSRDDFESGNGSQLFDLFILLDEAMIPTIIRYDHFGMEFFLLHIPKALTLTPFIKMYRSRLKKIHKEFYGKTSVGPSLGRFERQREILAVLKKYSSKEELLKVLKDEYGKNTLSYKNISKLVADKITTISAESIETHYWRTLKRFLQRLMKK